MSDTFCDMLWNVLYDPVEIQTQINGLMQINPIVAIQVKERLRVWLESFHSITGNINFGAVVFENSDFKNLECLIELLKKSTDENGNLLEDPIVQGKIEGLGKERASFFTDKCKKRTFEKLKEFENQEEYKKLTREEKNIFRDMLKLLAFEGTHVPRLIQHYCSTNLKIAGRLSSEYNSAGLEVLRYMKSELTVSLLRDEISNQFSSEASASSTGRTLANLPDQSIEA